MSKRKRTSSSSSSLSSLSSSLPRKKWIDALWTFMAGWKQPSATIDTGFASVLRNIRTLNSFFQIDKTHHIPFLQSSFVKITAHIASSPLWAVRSLVGPPVALSFPLSPCTSPSIPRSTILNNIAWTARLSLWFLDRMFAPRMSERMVLRMKARKVDDVVRGRSGKRDFNKSIDTITFLFLNITRFWTSVLRVSGVKVP